MPRIESPIFQRRVKVFVGLILGAMLYAEIRSPAYQPIVNPGSPVVLGQTRESAGSFEKLIRENPLAALIEARDKHLQQVTDYECTLLKQELLPSGMGPEQEIQVKFRQDPYSVYMFWTRNGGLARQALYVKERWVNRDADTPEERDLAKCQGTLFNASLTQPIHGWLAKRTARRAIDEFGFARTLDLLIKYCQIANTRNELTLTFRGDSRFDGRPVWVVRRHLPYKGEDGHYPDQAAEFFIDKEYHVPIAIYCYSSDEMKPAQLLGKYEYRNIRFGTGLVEKDFEPATYGM